MVIALICGLILCAILIVLGALVWFIPTPFPFVMKVMLSASAILAGIALGAIGIEFLRDELEVWDEDPV